MSRLALALACLFVAGGAPAEESRLYRCAHPDDPRDVRYTNKRTEGAKCVMIAPMPTVGDRTDKGLIIEVNAPIVKVQTQTGERWFEAEELKPVKLPTKP
jgi:hypothetical protein